MGKDVDLVDNEIVETAVPQGVSLSTASNHPTIRWRPVEVPNSSLESFDPRG